MNNYFVKEITRKDCEYFILNIHYLGRWPSISYAFGLYYFNELIGCVTYGTPPSHSLRIGIAGERFKNNVLELNRLVLKYNRKNEASFLISRSFKLLPNNKIIVSFADISNKHIGYIYQATNFYYCGLSAKRTDWKVKGKDGHGQTIADEFRGKKNRSKLMKDKYGNDFYLENRPRKHRYIYINGDKRFKREVLKNLKYKIYEYPKNE